MVSFDYYHYEDVKANGILKGEPGAIETKGYIRLGIGEGCGLDRCGCSPGFWISISTPSKGGKVEVITATFKSRDEMIETLCPSLAELMK